MPNPTEGLTDEQINTLRFIAQHPLVIEEDSENFYSADYCNVCGFVDIADGSWRISHAGRVVLATLDRREREAAAVTEAAQAFAEVWKHLEWHTDGHGSAGLGEFDNNRLDNAVDELLAALPGEGE